MWFNRTWPTREDKTFLDHYLLEDDLANYLEPWEYGQLNMVEQILLARRIDGERPKTARHVADLLRLLPPTSTAIYLFDTASQGRSLGNGRSAGAQAGR